MGAPPKWLLTGIAGAVCVACGRVREYDYDDLLEGRPAVVERHAVGYCSRDPGGMPEDEVEAHHSAFQWHRVPLPAEFEINGYRRTDVEFTGAVDRAGNAEVTFRFEFLLDEVDEVRLFIDGDIVDTATRSGGELIDMGGGFGRATLTGWTPPPRTNYIPWQRSPRTPEWKLEWSGSEDRWGTRRYYEDPFADKSLWSD